MTPELVILDDQWHRLVLRSKRCNHGRRPTPPHHQRPCTRQGCIDSSVSAGGAFRTLDGGKGARPPTPKGRLRPSSYFTKGRLRPSSYFKSAGVHARLGDD